MGEVVYGIDFRAGKEEAPLCNAPDAPEFGGVVGCKHWNKPNDTASPEYVAPSDDCA